MAQSGLPENVFYAAIIGDTLTIQEWLTQGGDPNQGLEQAFHEDDASWESGSTLLIAAASMGRLDIMHLLLVDHNADVNVTAGWTALMWACAQGRRQHAEALIAAGCDPWRESSELVFFDGRYFSAAMDACTIATKQGNFGRRQRHRTM